jgi:uncharacterized iron-regulated membrane protein
VLRWFCAAVIGTVVSGFAFLLVTGRYINDGPIIARLGAGHGVHLGDVFVAAGWAVAMVMLAVLARPSWGIRRAPAGPDETGRLLAPVGRADRPASSR